MTEPFGKNTACWPKPARPTDCLSGCWGRLFWKLPNIYKWVIMKSEAADPFIPISHLLSCKPQIWIFTGLRCLEKCRSAACVCKESKGTFGVASLTSHSFSVIKTPRNGLVEMQCKASLSSCVESVFLISYSKEWSKFTSISVVTKKKIADFSQKDSLIFSSFILYMLPQSTVIWQWEHPMFQLVRPPLATINHTVMYGF